MRERRTSNPAATSLDSMVRRCTFAQDLVRMAIVRVGSEEAERERERLEGAGLEVSWSAVEGRLMPCLLGVAGEGEGGKVMVAMLGREGVASNNFTVCGERHNLGATGSDGTG